MITGVRIYIFFNNRYIFLLLATLTYSINVTIRLDNTAVSVTGKKESKWFSCFQNFLLCISTHSFPFFNEVMSITFPAVPC
jgi:hypothetical protein